MGIIVKMIGIVAEYNPFHEGHKYHIENATDGCVVAVMSGDFVQRGEPAILDKFSRSAQACRQGVNLVVELPVPWALASAEHFARGAVAVLESLGVDAINFGSECGDIDLLYDLASKVNDSTELIKQYLKMNPQDSYPVARRNVVGSEILDYPNNSLGIEYIKAASVKCDTVKRLTLHDGIGSAKEIRDEMKMLGIGVDFKTLETAIISRLRMFDKDYYNELPDSSDGIGNRLYEAVRNNNTLEDIYSSAKTKSVTMSAVRRLAMCAALGIKDEYLDKYPPYIRVLAFDDIGREVLSKNSSIPVITQPKEIRRLNEFANKVFALGASAHDLYLLGMYGKSSNCCGEDYRNGPFIVKNA